AEKAFDRLHWRFLEEVMKKFEIPEEFRAVVEALHSELSTRISYGATDYTLSDRHLYPNFFRMLQNDRVINKIISQLLKHFNWFWIGILASDDSSGETEELVLRKYMAEYGICVAFILKFNINSHKFANAINQISPVIQGSSAKVILIIGSFNLAIVDILLGAKHLFYGKTIILPPSWSANNFLTDYFIEPLNGSLAIDLYPMAIPPFGSFFDNINPSKYPNDKMLEDIWISELNCLSRNTTKNILFSTKFGNKLSNCTGSAYTLKAKDHVYRGSSPRMYYAVVVMAYALNEMNMYLKRQSNKINLKNYNYRHQ
ncbi:Hypothetical predicted protein, partial [Pelobates cultripes]